MQHPAGRNRSQPPHQTGRSPPKPVARPVAAPPKAPTTPLGAPQGPLIGQNSPTSPKGLNYRMTIRHRALRHAPKRRRPQLAAVSRRSLATAARPDETSWPQQTGW